MEKNYLKQNNYAEQAVRLKKALKYEFYVEALAIEYAMIEDRIQSILKNCGFSLVSKKGRPYSIKQNIDRLKNNEFFNTDEMCKRIPLELLDHIEEWKANRNTVMHKMLKTEFAHGEIKKLALLGNDLRKQIDYKAKSVKLFIEKNRKEANK